MSLTSRLKNPKPRNVRLMVVLITMLVILTTGGILVHAEQQKRIEQVQSDGITLARILSDMPHQLLVDGGTGSGLIHLLKSYSGENALAYVVIADAQGATVNQVISQGIEPPNVALSENATLWLNQYSYWHDDTEIIEFQVPVLDSQQHILGYVRTGYVSPPFTMLAKDISLLAQIALPIFLLVPVFYFFLSNGLQPLHDANRQIRELIGDPQDADGPPAEYGEFIQNFNSYVLDARQQMGELETEKQDAITSNRILDYHKKRVETTLQTIPDAVIVIDESGIATFANNRVTSLIGPSPEEIMGKSTAEWCSDQAMTALLAKYQSNISSLKREDRVEFNPLHSPGKTVLTRVHPLFSPKDSSVVLGALVVLRDITEDVMARASRDEFVAHVSHELKSPLNVISMRGELLLDLVTDDSGQLVENVNIIQDEVNRLAVMIDDLLNITQIETGSVALNRKRVKLKEMLEDIYSSFLPAAQQKQISIDIDLPQNMSAMNIDKELMRVAINNLLTNAIKYSNQGAKIAISAEESATEVNIKVEDTGIGISEDDLGCIFDKFFRSDSDDVKGRPGHGLGLSLAHEIISLHHGELTATSEPGIGTTFNVQLMKTSTLLKEAS